VTDETQNTTNDVQENKEEKQMKTYTMKITGMMCQHCVAHVKKALEGVGAAAEVDLEKGEAVVKADDSIAPDTLKNAVTEAGYEVTQLQ
jgi:copper chaperone CopZ